jgi:hypothetical protein
MRQIWMRSILMCFGLLEASLAQASVDSYRFAHVTISTPWYIFIFLLMGIFAPFILMAILAWRNATRKTTSEIQDAGHNSSID